jgi:hypothetical protein
MNTLNLERFKNKYTRAQFAEELRLVRRRDHIIKAFFTSLRPEDRPVYHVLRQIWDNPTTMGEDVGDISTNEIRQVLSWVADRATYWEEEIRKLEAGAEIVDESSEEHGATTDN